MKIYINKAGQQLGPFEEEKVKEMLSTGELTDSDLGIRHGESKWQKLGGMYPDFEKLTSPAPSSPIPAKSRKGLLLGCSGFFLFGLLVAGILGFFAYRNLNPTGTAQNMPKQIGDFKIDNPEKLDQPKGNIWGSEKQFSATYQKSKESQAIIVMTEYSDKSQATKVFDELPVTKACLLSLPINIEYLNKSGIRVSKMTVCNGVFVMHENQIFEILVISESTVPDAKNIIDNLPFNVGATSQQM